MGLRMNLHLLNTVYVELTNVLRAHRPTPVQRLVELRYPTAWQLRLSSFTTPLVQDPHPPMVPRTPAAKLPHTYSPLEDAATCIRLVIINQGNKADGLHLEFVKGRHVLGNEHTSPYHALSYVWGSEVDAVAVDFGPDRVSCVRITQNLAVALLHLRWPDRPRIMWIDAICIDQRNDAEKSQQVAIMGGIYKHASCTVAWLGPEADGSHRALELVQEIGASMDFRPAYSADDQVCLEALLQREWFERLWIRQEVALSPRVVVQVGSSSAGWDTFAVGVRQIRNAGRDVLPFTRRSAARRRLRLVFSVCRSAHLYDVENLIVDVAGAKCRDPRDKIYAVLHLVHGGLLAELMVPDYSKSVAEVYQQAALIEITGRRSLNIMKGCQHPEGSSRVDGLPSWVPDWSADGDAIRVMGTAAVLAIRPFSPILNHAIDGTLRLSGVRCAQVSSAVELPSHPALSIDSLVHIYTTILAERGDEYVAGGSLANVFCRHLYLDQFRETLPRSVPAEDWPSLADVEWLFKIMVGHNTSAEFDPAEARSALAGYCPDMHLSHIFTTDEGYIGSGPDDVRAGDVVVMLPGCGRPIVLRPSRGSGSSRNDEYRVVGECVMAGVMAAEPLLGPLPDHLRRGWDERLTFSLLRNAITGEVERDPRLLSRLGIDEAAILARDGRLPKRYDVSAQQWALAGVNLQQFDLV
jgi:hypothetical protein